MTNTYFGARALTGFQGSSDCGRRSDFFARAQQVVQPVEREARQGAAQAEEPRRVHNEDRVGAALVLRGDASRYAKGAVLLLPYDLREMTMLGDAGANALGAVLGLSSVGRLTGRGRFVAIAGLTGLTLLGEHLSLGAVIERTPGLAQLDRLGRRA